MSLQFNSFILIAYDSPFCEYTTICLFTPLSYIWVIASFWLLWLYYEYPNTCFLVCMSFDKHMFAFLLAYIQKWNCWVIEFIYLLL